MMRRKLSVPLQDLRNTLCDVPYDQWNSIAKIAVEKTIEMSRREEFVTNEHFRQMLASEGFLQ